MIGNCLHRALALVNFAAEAPQNNQLLTSRNRHQNMTQNEHVYAICHRPEVGGDVISGGNVKTIEGYAALNFEFDSSNSFRDIQKTFRDGGGEHRR